jgi:hypothetical protein
MRYYALLILLAGALYAYWDASQRAARELQLLEPKGFECRVFKHIAELYDVGKGIPPGESSPVTRAFMNAVECPSEACVLFRGRYRMPEYYLDMERYFYDGGCVDGEKGDFKALTDMGDNVQVNIAGQIMNVSATGPYRGKIRVPCTFEDPDANIQFLLDDLEAAKNSVIRHTLARDKVETRLRGLLQNYQDRVDEGEELRPKEEDALLLGEEFIKQDADYMAADGLVKGAEALVVKIGKDIENFDDRPTVQMIGTNDEGAAYLFNISFKMTTYPYDDWAVKQEIPIPRYKHRGVPIRPETWDTEEQRTFPQTKKMIDELNCRGDGTAANPLYDITSCADNNARHTWLDCDIDYDVNICFTDLCNLCNGLRFGLLLFLVESRRQH